MARQTQIACDLCNATPARPVSVAVNGLPQPPGGGKRKSGRRSLDLCAAHAERYNLGLTQYQEGVLDGTILLPELPTGASLDNTDGGTVDLTEEGPSAGTDDAPADTESLLLSQGESARQEAHDPLPMTLPEAAEPVAAQEPRGRGRRHA